ncbi:hypothetical protein ABKA04_008329 [Annulohypoxylon sp. FPYF3050]
MTRPGKKETLTKEAVELKIRRHILMSLYESWPADDAENREGKNQLLESILDMIEKSRLELRARFENFISSEMGIKMLVDDDNVPSKIFSTMSMWEEIRPILDTYLAAFGARNVAQPQTGLQDKKRKFEAGVEPEGNLPKKARFDENPTTQSFEQNIGLMPTDTATQTPNAPPLASAGNPGFSFAGYVPQPVVGGPAPEFGGPTSENADFMAQFLKHVSDTAATYPPDSNIRGFQ